MHTKQGLTPIVLIIITAILLGGGYVAYRASQQPGADYLQPTTDNSPQEKQASADANDWKTYRNERYGFEMKYPPDWESGYANPAATEREDFSYIRLRSDLTRSISIQVTPAESVSSQPYYLLEGDISKIASQMFSDVSRFEIVTLNGVPSIKTKEGGFILFHRNPNFEVFISDSSLVSEYGKYNLVDQKIIEEMLSTFKFFKSTDIIDWKTYTNDEYGYEFKYPPILHVNRSSYANPGRVLFLTQEKTEPKISFGDLCGNAKDYIEFTNYHDITSGGQYSDVDSEILAVTKAYEKDGGKKIFDESVDRIRTVKYASGISGQPIPSHVKKFTGSEMIDIAYVSCAGGDIPIDIISSTLKFTK